MSGVNVKLLSHVVRRGVEHVQSTTTMSQGVQPGMPGGNMESPPVIEGAEMFVFIAIGIITIATGLLIASVDYTIGSVMTANAMIESPSSTTLVETKPPAYSEEPDATLEKKPLVELTDDVEVTVINHKPITAKTVTFVKHLHRVGGFWSRWRGLGQYILYNFLTNIVGHFVSGLIATRVNGPDIGAMIFGHIFATLALVRVHMLWTHAMVGMPSNTPWYRRFANRKQCRILLIPTLVQSIASQLVFLVPVAVAFLLFVPLQTSPEYYQSLDAGSIALIVLKVLAIPASALLIVLKLLLPAAGALTRLEASLLPEGQETIVPFDRDAILGDIDLTQRGGARRVYAAAWKSFDATARRNVVKIQVKLFFFELAMIFIAMHVMGALVFVAGKDRMVNTTINALGLQTPMH